MQAPVQVPCCHCSTGGWFNYVTEILQLKIFCLLGQGLFDDVTKSQTGIFRFWAQVTYQQGIAKREMPTKRTYLGLCTVHYLCPWLRSPASTWYTYWPLVYLRRWFVWNPLSFFMFPTSTWAIANMQRPSNKNTAFIYKGISLAVVVNIDRLYVTANVLMNVHTCFYWNQMTFASVMCLPVL